MGHSASRFRVARPLRFKLFWTASFMTNHSDKTINRLKRIEGQVRGIIRMLEDERYCIDVLTQMQAVKSALARAESEILKDHAQGCVNAVIESGDPDAQRQKVSELVDLFDKLKR